MPLKYPEDTYPERLNRFLSLMNQVGGLCPTQAALWEVMDSVAFEDTQAALQTALYNRQAVPVCAARRRA